MAVSPTVRRRRLAAELRQLRESLDLTIDEAAASADISKSALSRIENALVPAKPPVVRSLIYAYAVEEPKAGMLLELARDAGQTGWWHAYGDIMSNKLSGYIGFEAEATGIRSYEALVVPGLLQTRAYAELIYRGFRTEPYLDEDIDRLVEARMKRQGRIPELNLRFIVEEGVLRRPAGNPDVMREQLDQLLTLSRLNNLTLQVMPEAAGMHPGLDGSFSMFEFSDDNDADIAYAATQGGEIWIEKPEDVQRLERIFAHLEATALSSKDSQSLIRRYKDQP